MNDELKQLIEQADATMARLCEILGRIEARFDLHEEIIESIQP